MAGAVGRYAGDPGVQAGIKLGLAGCLAVFVSEALRLDDPAWALITTLILMGARYVGSIGEKSALRLLGTVLGALVGFLLTGWLEQSPVVFLFLLWVVLSASIAFYGQPSFPYAFYLFGLTALIVPAQSMGDPSRAWQIALVRVQEVGVGVLVTLLVSWLVWPRYARHEFQTKAFALLNGIAEGIRVATEGFLEGGQRGGVEKLADGRVGDLRVLLASGMRESAFLRRHRATYFAVASGIARASSRIFQLASHRPVHPVYHQWAAREIAGLAGAVSHVYASLAAGDREAARMWLQRSSEARAALDGRLDAMAEALDMPGVVSDSDARNFGGWLLALEEIQADAKELEELQTSLAAGKCLPSVGADGTRPPMDPAWIRNGLRSGFAGIVALVIQNWLEPPGGAAVTLSAFIFTALSRTYSGGQGDRRAFHAVVGTGLLFLAVVPGLILLAPGLVDYGFFNVCLFFALFLHGYWSERVEGFTFLSMLVILVVPAVVAQDPQRGLSFQGIMGIGIGTTMGVLIAAVVQRLLWPVLPQFEVRGRIRDMLADCRHIMENGPAATPRWRFSRLALLPSECAAWIGVMGRPDCPPGERGNLLEANQSVARLAAHLRDDALAPLASLPENLRAETAEAFRRLDRSISHSLEYPAAAIGGEEAPDPSRRVREERARLRVVARRARLAMLKMPVTNATRLRVNGMFDRHFQRASDALRIQSAFRRLRAHLYMRDAVL